MKNLQVVMSSPNIMWVDRNQKKRKGTIMFEDIDNSEQYLYYIMPNGALYFNIVKDGKEFNYKTITFEKIYNLCQGNKEMLTILYLALAEQEVVLDDCLDRSRYSYSIEQKLKHCEKWSLRLDDEIKQLSYGSNG